MNTKKEDGTISENNKDNMIVMNPHFQKVLNNNQPTDFRVIELIKQQKTMWHLDKHITWDEFNLAINGIKSMIATVLNGVPPEEFKDTDEDCRRYVFDSINEFWNDRADFETWNKIKCVSVPKLVYLSYPKKWRGVMLLGVIFKIFRSVINVCCFEILDTHRTKFQFVGMPNINFSNGILTIKTLLNMKKNHNLPTFAAFVDLVNYFDNAGHELLTKLLEIYGSPPEFSLNIHIMYKIFDNCPQDW